MIQEITLSDKGKEVANKINSNFDEIYEDVQNPPVSFYEELSFVGAGQTGVSKYFDCKIAPKVNYRLYLPTDVDMTGISGGSGYARFILYLCNNDNPTTERQTICRYDLGEDLPEYVEFSTEDAEHTTLYMFGRCTSGVTFVTRLVQAQGCGSGSGKLFADREPLRDIIANKSDKTFLFFSDIHAQTTNMAHILDVAKRWSDDGKLDAILNGGDTTYELQSNDISWYFDAIDELGIDVVLALGNHEIKGTTSTPATLATAYTKYIAPTIQRLTGAVQPSGASTNNLCYYYKDYGNLRVISFDTPNTNALPSNPPYAVNAQDAAAYLEAENIWLEGVLDDAKTNNKQVLILTHYPFEWTDAEIAEGTLNWNSFYRYEKGEVDNSTKWDIADSTCDVVDAFINGGGYFVGWFTGHIHYNNFVTNEQHPKQIMWNIGTAKNDYGQPDMPYTTDPSNPNYDQFCYIGIDLTHHLLKIMKIGRQRCNQLRYQNCICWDYDNNKLVANND